MELCSGLCGSLDGRGVWGRMETCICMAESLPCSPETITTLLISYTLIQIKSEKNVYDGDLIRKYIVKGFPHLVN